MSFTNPNTGDHPRDDLAAYALDAVDGAERQAIESHLALCHSCRRELAAHEEVLSRMVVDERPPATVWDQIVAQTQPQPQAGAPEADQRRPAHDDVVPLATLESARHLSDERRARPRRRLAGALAVAAVVIAVAGIGTAVVNEMVGDDGGQDIEVVAETVGVISGDGVELAEVTVDEAGAAYVEFTAASTLDADHTYQLWSTDGAEPVSLGVLGTGSDREVGVTLPEGTTRVAISEEPAGGSIQPTAVVGQGELSLPA
jgi:Anti-sigma-K factor rskA/Putative zinc-finger